MGLAFRGYVVGDVRAGSPGASALAAGGLSSRYRLFVDPLMMQVCLDQVLPAIISHDRYLR